MKKTIHLQDNHSDAFKFKEGQRMAKYFSITENSEDAVQEDQLSRKQVELLKCLNDTIGNVIGPNNRRALIFPKDLDTYADGIQDDRIINVVEENDSCVRIDTGNIMGFIGVHDYVSGDDVFIRIQSRFDSGNEDGTASTKDYFMHYLLQKVMCINVVNLTTEADNKDDVFDFYTYLLPGLIKMAMKQGFYKTYVYKKFNDARAKGPLDVARHIKLNIPFTGNIAYSAREHSVDNPLMHLIRHALEELKSRPEGRSILNSDPEILEYVKLIESCTNTYRAKDRISVLQQNLKAVRHPLYAEYESLRKLCINILNKDRLKFAESVDCQNNKAIYGILFDGAWLWEEYIASVFNKAAINRIPNVSLERVIHPQNKKKSDPIYVFENDLSVKRYPDYYNEGRKYVMDAKYKHTEVSSNFSDIDRNDLNQMISYLYILGNECKKGIFIYPCHTHKVGDKMPYFSLKLEGRGGSISKLLFKIPNITSDFKHYKEAMEKCEAEFINNLNSIIKG